MCVSAELACLLARQGCAGRGQQAQHAWCLLLLFGGGGALESIRREVQEGRHLWQGDSLTTVLAHFHPSPSKRSLHPLN